MGLFDDLQQAHASSDIAGKGTLVPLVTEEAAYGFSENGKLQISWAGIRLADGRVFKLRRMSADLDALRMQVTENFFKDDYEAPVVNVTASGYITPANDPHHRLAALKTAIGRGRDYDPGQDNADVLLNRTGKRGRYELSGGKIARKQLTESWAMAQEDALVGKDAFDKIILGLKAMYPAFEVIREENETDDNEGENEETAEKGEIVDIRGTDTHTRFFSNSLRSNTVPEEETSPHGA